MKRYLAGLFLLGMLTYGSGAARADLITDGGFESGTANQTSPPGWSFSDPLSGGNSGVNVGQGAQTAHSGSNFYGIGSSTTVTLTQSNITTTSGVNYTLSYFLATGGANSGDSFSASWNGTTISGSTVSGPITSGSAPNPYTQYTFTVVGSGSSGTLAFSANNTPSYWYLDDVSLLAPVPEPSSMALGGVAVLGMIVPLGWRWRRSKKTEPAASPQAA
jgi:hypothetical protein